MTKSPNANRAAIIPGQVRRKSDGAVGYMYERNADWYQCNFDEGLADYHANEIESIVAYDLDAIFAAIGENIKNARTERSLYQYHLAERLGITQSAIAHHEAGKNINVSSLMAIATALGMPMIDLLPQECH